MSDETTHAQQPTPRRPKHLWYAWEATVGYIHTYQSADATLLIIIHPLEHYIGWDAELKWGQDSEIVTDKVDFSIALTDLWALVEQNHTIFETPEEAIRRPANYTDGDILDEPTYAVFSGLVNATDTVFQGDWQIMITYRPIEAANKRAQTRLTADNHKVNWAGNGATLREACRSLLHNAAPTFHQYRTRQNDDE